MANVNDTTLDCSIEEGAVVHAYSTIAAGFDHANFGIDTLLPAVVPHPSAPGAPSSKDPLVDTILLHFNSTEDRGLKRGFLPFL